MHATCVGKEGFGPCCDYDTSRSSVGVLDTNTLKVPSYRREVKSTKKPVFQLFGVSLRETVN